jgi:hypothetical protein
VALLFVDKLCFVLLILNQKICPKISTDQILLEEILKDYAESNPPNNKDCFDNLSESYFKLP